MATIGEYEPVIGLEVHAQLLTRTKTFCGCSVRFGDPPNTHTCPVCLGLPGALPVLNREAVRMAVSAALAVGCTVQQKSVFSRKNYFYPDLPKGYQISQFDLPLALHGALEVEVDGVKRRAGILRVHMEEDAGKNVHGIGGDSVVDLNRAGTPLIEIVGDPDLRSSAEAAEYLRRLRDILMFIGVNDGNLEQGSFRCDANVSVRKAGTEPFGTRVELKNINSFRFVAEAIDIEARRQIALIERGERVRQQTRGYNADKRETYLLRDKENEAGYRYFPEPDLPPLVVEPEFVAAIRSALPPPPAERRRRLIEDHGLAPNAASVLTSHPRIAAFFDDAGRLYADKVKLGNFIQSEVMRDVRTTGLTATFPVSPAQVAELLSIVDKGTISGKQAKEVYAAIAGTEFTPEEIIRARGMAVLSDEGSIESIAREVLAQNPKQAAGYRSGKTALLGYFVGMMMKRTGGSASPAVVNAVLKRLLDDPSPKAEEHPTMPPPPPKPAAHAPLTQPAPAAAPLTPQSIQASSRAHSPLSITEVPPDQDRSPMAHSVAPVAPTLTSAAGMRAIVLPPEGGAGAGKVPTAPPRSEPIPFEVFSKIDLRVGVIVSAARVPGKDKLLDLRVDVGEGIPRAIVAGLALSFPPEELVGKSVVVAVNLEPRVFSKDLVSDGMILAAGPSESLALCTVSRDVPAGTRVK